jgi:penicillin-binding protein 1C
MTPDDPLVERPLLSPGAAWIVRRILAGEAQPVPDASLVQVVPLAWKTGTSYGYRDAWAIGVNARYLIGIWTGRPDGTPVVGQFGFASAVPLLNQVNNMLLARPAMSRGGLPADPRPQTVSAGRSAGPAGRICRGRQQLPTSPGDWLLDDSQPPTLLLPGQEGGGIRFPVWLDEQGGGWRRIVPARCEKSSMSGRCRWNPGCPAERRARGPGFGGLSAAANADAAPLVLSGVVRGGD